MGEQWILSFVMNENDVYLYFIPRWM